MRNRGRQKTKRTVEYMPLSCRVSSHCVCKNGMPNKIDGQLDDNAHGCANVGWWRGLKLHDGKRVRSQRAARVAEHRVDYTRCDRKRIGQIREQAVGVRAYPSFVNISPNGYLTRHPQSKYTGKVIISVKNTSTASLRAGRITTASPKNEQDRDFFSSSP
jgi:hypothetical protein